MSKTILTIGAIAVLLFSITACSHNSKPSKAELVRRIEKATPVSRGTDITTQSEAHTFATCMVSKTYDHLTAPGIVWLTETNSSKLSADFKKIPDKEVGVINKALYSC